VAQKQNKLRSYGNQEEGRQQTNGKRRGKEICEGTREKGSGSKG
jgi:hypothetical protein